MAQIIGQLSEEALKEWNEGKEIDIWEYLHEQYQNPPKILTRKDKRIQRELDNDQAEADREQDRADSRVIAQRKKLAKMKMQKKK